MTEYERLQELIAKFEESSLRKSGGKTRALIKFHPAWVDCNSALKPEGQYRAECPAYSQEWMIDYQTHQKWGWEYLHRGGSIGTTIEECIRFLELHFEKFGDGS